MAETRIKETCTGFKSIYGDLDNGFSYQGILCNRCKAKGEVGCPGITIKKPEVEAHG